MGLRDVLKPLFSCQKGDLSSSLEFKTVFLPMNKVHLLARSAAMVVAFMATLEGADKAALPKRIDTSLNLIASSGLSSSIQAGPRLSRALPPTRNGLVPFEAFAKVSGGTLGADLKALGASSCRTYPGVVTGLLPVNKIPALSQLDSVAFARATWSRTLAGSASSQADAAAAASLARSRFAISGAGKKVGIISDSFDSQLGMSYGVASGDLPAGIDIVLDGLGFDEGRAMAELIHDSAPGASLAFHAAGNAQQDLANAFLTLAGLAAGSASHRCDVIVDDISFYAEPMFADGVVAQAIDAAKAAGITVVSAAGNDSRNSFEDGPWQPSGITGDGGGIRHRFNSDPSNPVTLLPITLDFGVTTFVLQWADAYKSTAPSSPSNPGAYHDIDIFLHNADGTYVLDGNGQRIGSMDHNVGNDPVEVFSVINFGGPTSFALSLEYAGNRDGGSAPATGSPAVFKLVWSGNATVDAYPSKKNKSSIYGHANAAGCVAVGAVAYFNTPAYGRTPVPQSFSSLGGTPILVDASGGFLGSPIVRNKPDFCAPDGANTSFFYLDSDGDAFPNFVGTSAAAASAAAVAALMLEAKPSLTPDALATALRSTTTDMLSSGFDFDSGHGLINAAAAVQSVSAAAPALVGDLDANGCVGLSDLALLQAALRNKSNDPKFDINKDGRLTIADTRSLTLLFTNPSGICP